MYTHVVQMVSCIVDERNMPRSYYTNLLTRNSNYENQKKTSVNDTESLKSFLL